MSDNYLSHYGVKGMKWGRRKGVADSHGRVTYNPISKRKIAQQERMKKIAEKELGRKVKEDDFAFDITRKGIKQVKKIDAQKQRYENVKKESDPVFGYMRGRDVVRNTHLSDKQMDRIIKKLEKDPTLSAKSLQEIELEKNVKIQRGKKFVSIFLI